MKHTYLLLVGLLTGCAIPKGDVVSITQSVIGIKIGQNPATQTPELQIGFFRSTYQIVPTSSNDIFAPMVNSSLSLDQKAFSTGIDEVFTTGGSEPLADESSPAVIGAKMRAKEPKTGK